MEQELQKEQKCSFYALEQLRQTAETILRGSQRLLKCRAGVEKYRTAQPQRAYAYYLELQKTRDALLVALGEARRSLLELEESALAQKAGQLQAGLHRFDLMSRAYKPVYEVLTGLCPITAANGHRQRGSDWAADESCPHGLLPNRPGEYHAHPARHSIPGGRDNKSA